jgi:hypothetical protein
MTRMGRAEEFKFPERKIHYLGGGWGRAMDGLMDSRPWTMDNGWTADGGMDGGG